MTRFAPALPSREFFATKSGKAKLYVMFGGLAALFGWVAWASLDPHFLEDSATGKVRVLRDLQEMLPDGGASVLWGALALGTIGFLALTARRHASRLPLLILSEAGIHAFPNLMVARHGFLSFADLASVSTYKSVMIFYGKRASMFGKRTVLAVNLSEIGVKAADMHEMLDQYVTAGNAARASGRAAVDFVYPQMPAKAAAVPVNASPRAPQPVAARPYQSTPDFGRRMTRI